MGGTEKRGGKTNILKRGQDGSRGGCVKKGGEGAGIPLPTMRKNMKEKMKKV